MAKRSRRTTVTYDLIRNGKIVYRGSTRDPEQRQEEHRGEGKKFDRLKVTSPRLTRESAKRREAENLEKFRSRHGGKNPQYNQDVDG